jgi:hypothetical protein
MSYREFARLNRAAVVKRCQGDKVAVRTIYRNAWKHRERPDWQPERYLAWSVIRHCNPDLAL